MKNLDRDTQSSQEAREKTGMVLVVDDEEDVRNVCSRVLQKAGFSVESSENASRGMELIRSGSFDAVVTDIQMPGMGGLDFLAMIKIFHIDADEPSLIKETSQMGEEPLEFSLDLSFLNEKTPSSSVVKRFSPQKKIFAFYYPWYDSLTYWESNPLLQDTPSEPYTSNDPACISRHIDQAKEAGIDGFISSWWGPGSYTDENLKILLDIAKEKNFSVLINFETLDYDQLTFRRFVYEVKHYEMH